MTGNDLQQQLERHGLSLTDWAKRTGNAQPPLFADAPPEREQEAMQYE